MSINISLQQPPTQRYIPKISAQNQWEDYKAHLEYISQNEVWMPIRDFEDLYEVSSFGRVKSLAKIRKGKSGLPCKQKDKFLKTDQNGKDYYLRKSLCRDNLIVSMGVHELVAHAFLIVPPQYDTINHEDGNKQNNHVSNLSFASYAENNEHARKTGLNNSIAQNHANSKLTNEQALEIAKSPLLQKELAIIYGVCETVISAIKIGRTWSSVTGIVYEKNKNRLSEETILEIFNSSLTYSQIAKKYGVCKSHVTDIKVGRRNSKITGKYYKK